MSRNFRVRRAVPGMGRVTSREGRVSRNVEDQDSETGKTRHVPRGTCE